jgi:hypothetical protein
MKLTSSEKKEIKNYLTGKTVPKDKFLIALLFFLSEDKSLLQKLIKSL